MWLFRLSNIPEFLCAFQSFNFVQQIKIWSKCKRPAILFKAFFVKSIEVDCIFYVLFSRWIFFFLGGGESAKVNLSFPWFIFDLSPLWHLSYVFFIVFYPYQINVHHNTEEKKNVAKDIHPFVAFANRPRVKIKTIADRKQELSCLNSS